ncbi:Uncharacterised protein [uncultured archaeon]|nr:Uncharacterised protein [uncultured archaeon]
MAGELTPVLALPAFDPVFVLLSIPVALALLAAVYAWVKKRTDKKKTGGAPLGGPEAGPGLDIAEINARLEKEKHDSDFDSSYR